MRTAALNKRIEARLSEIDSISEHIPGVVIVHNFEDLSVVYMSQRGQRILGVREDELVKMGPEYYNRFFNAAEAQEHVPRMIELLKGNNNDEIVALFQQVRPSDAHDWTWYCASTKVFMRDDQGNPVLAITVAIPIDPKHHITNKVVRLLDENNFLRKNYEKFTLLTRREKEVLRCLALGKTAAELSEELHISVATAETHRKNIKRKLSISSSFDLSQYTRAFDLI